MASLYADYYKVNVSARCEIGGTSLPLSGFELNFGINSIPSATLSLPVGRSAGGSQLNAISPAMTELTDLGPLTTVKVYATFTSSPAGRGAPDTADGPGFPDGEEFLVFDGLLRSPIYTRNTETLSVTIQAMGVTAGLASGTPFVSGLVASDIENGDGIATSFFTDGPASADLLSSYLEDNGPFDGDLWEDLLSVILEEILTTPTDLASTTSALAQAAFLRINKFDGALTEASVEIAGIEEIDDNMATKCVLTPVLQEFWDTFVGGTSSGDAWTAMMSVLQLFGAKYVCAIEEDAILPITFGLGGSTAWRTLQPDEYFYIEGEARFDEKFYSYITQVVLFSSAFQSSQWQASSPKARKIGQAMVTSGDADAGRLLMVPAPAWLVPYSAPATTSVNPGGTIPDASNPTPAASTPAPGQGNLEQEFFASGMGDNYAEAVLYDSIFAHRKMAIGGRVRFDIAPGSLLKLVTPGSDFTGESANLWAHVESVKISVSGDATNPHAATSFGLTNVRSDQEQQTLTTPLEDHPVFASAWLGGKLSAEA